MRPHYRTCARTVARARAAPRPGPGARPCPARRLGGHPARYPLRLALDVVACFCPPAGIACDPFMGSGTSAVACAMLHRRVIGGDIGARETDGKRWADIARERADAVANPAQRSLFA